MRLLRKIIDWVLGRKPNLTDGWSTITIDMDTYIVTHIIPNNDYGVHIEDVSCPCQTKLEFSNPNYLVIHNSFDRRELYECSKKSKKSSCVA